MIVIWIVGGLAAWLVVGIALAPVIGGRMKTTEVEVNIDTCPGKCYCCIHLAEAVESSWPFDWCKEKDDLVNIMGSCESHRCKFEETNDDDEEN